MDNAAWFTKQMRHLRDDVVWVTERALTEISSREEELYLLWSDQVARDYRTRYGALRLEVQTEALQALREIVAALEVLETSLAGVSQSIGMVDARLTEARHLHDRVNAHIENAHRHIDDSEMHTGQVERKIIQAHDAMHRAIQLLSSTESADSTAGPERGVSPFAQQCGSQHTPSEGVQTVDVRNISGARRDPLRDSKGIGVWGASGGFDQIGLPMPPPIAPAPTLTSPCGLSSALQIGPTGLDSSVGSATPSWAFRQGNDLVLGFSTVSPPGALPFLGTSPAPASSYLSLRLGSDSNWHTPLGFGTVPTSYDLKIGTGSLSLGWGGFEQAPPISVSSPDIALSTGGAPSMVPIQGFGDMGVDAAPSTWGGVFGSTCCLSS